MSVEFTSSTHVCGIDSDTALNHRAFTVTLKAFLNSDTAGPALSIDTTEQQYHELYWAGSATGWRVGVNYRNATNSRTIGTTPTGEWVSLGLVGLANASDLSELRGHVRPSGGAMLSVTAPNHAMFVDTVDTIHLSGGYVGLSASSWLRGKVADVKIWSRSLSDAEVEAEFDSQAPVSSTGLVCANYFDGGDITAALTSDISNATYANVWSNLDFQGATFTNPGYSTAAPTYAAAGVTLSGTVAMPTTAPSPGVDVVSFRSNSVQAAASVSVTYNTAPASDRLLVACVGGYTTATAVTISDNRGGAWTQQVLAEGSSAAADIVVGAWTANVPSGSGPYTITATPVGTTNNFITLTVLEVTKHFAPSPIDVVSAASRGSGTSVAIDVPPTVSAKTLVLSLASWLNTTTVASAGGSNLEVAQKSGGAGLVIAKRYVTSAGNYDGAFTLSESDSWVGVGLAITEDQGTVGGGMPPIVRNKRRRSRR